MALTTHHKHALLSVSDKAGITEFAQGLLALGFTLLSTGGTAKLLRERGILAKDTHTNTIRIAPPLVIGRSEIDWAIAQFDQPALTRENFGRELPAVRRPGILRRPDQNALGALHTRHGLNGDGIEAFEEHQDDLRLVAKAEDRDKNGIKREFWDGIAEHKDRFDQPVGEPQQRGLAGTGAADDGQEFAPSDLQRNIVHASNRTLRPEAESDV